MIKGWRTHNYNGPNVDVVYILAINWDRTNKSGMSFDFWDNQIVCNEQTGKRMAVKNLYRSF